MSSPSMAPPRRGNGATACCVLDDLAGADGEERLPAAAGAGGAADVGEG